MSRPRRIDPKLVAQARTVVAQATDLNDLRAAQPILLPALARTTLEEAAALPGVGRATVPRLQQRFREGCKDPQSAPKRWAGRRRALMTLEEEQAFLAPWVEQARNAGVLVVSPLRAALAEHLGQKVAASVVYRLLARHGWRRVAPDTQHPQHDLVAQAAWKKLADTLATLLTPEVVAHRPVHGMFQDEARFGRMVPQAVLGAEPPAPGAPQWLRTGICVRLWRGQPAGRRVGLAAVPRDEHGPDGGVSHPSRPGPSERVHRDGTARVRTRPRPWSSRTISACCRCRPMRRN